MLSISFCAPAVFVGCVGTTTVDSTATVERLVEQRQYDGDAVVEVGSESIDLTGAMLEDLARVHQAATRSDDHELALASAVTMIRIAGPDASHLGWRLLGQTLERSEPGLAVAIADHRLELVSSLERECGYGLQDSAMQCRSAAIRRSIACLRGSIETYCESKSWNLFTLGDDERGMQRAMVFALESNALMAAAGADHDMMLSILHQMKDCQTELSGGEAEDVHALWRSSMERGDARFRGALLRSSTALPFRPTAAATRPAAVAPDATSLSLMGGSR
jgi:hypothetical protein